MRLPKYLPWHVADNYNRMFPEKEKDQQEEKLDQKKKAFFTDERLDGFWKKASAWLDLQGDQDNQIEAGEYFIGVFLTPLKLYGKTGDANNPSPKTKTIELQRKADKLIGDAYVLADKLVNVLIELEKTSPYLQHESKLLPIARRLIPPLKDVKLASYYESIKTHEVISILKKSLLLTPATGDIFQGIAGMESQKSTPKDWYREAEESLARVLKKFPNGSFALTDAEWILLADILLDSRGRALVLHSKQDHSKKTIMK